ncbi:hypothetical protein SAMN02799624_05401 [Paenibacillus sp. UNC496MF]|uniref:hypothetical protein n=1 Tax=Paenibacillus sp. UNC496MF TaxID=1502753 RepID=UPI0008E527EF|nr:hypothetical protein [Paenibacillus sp. UNC496MF]SFJ65494.1 hypothetical protein SAMN02799624_05401 [Paenibacillus sp. UNC496MF]
MSMSEADLFWTQKLHKAQTEGLTNSERHEIRERYLAEQVKTNTFKMDKRTVLGKEDMMNLPRHKVHGYCSAFQECPLCYKCRNYDSSHQACRDCVLTEEKLHCNTQLHNERVLNVMIKRERIDLDGTDFRIFFVMQEDGSGHIARIILPGGSVVLYNQEQDTIDFEPMRPYMGRQFEYFVNGESQGKGTFKGYTEVNGIKAIQIEGDLR